tara:strand:+ start:504 stop:1106 length:603 start_codon:yes stop_codon:yes gene_type:complete
MLQVENISFEYPDHEVLKHISLSLKSGELLHLRGGNGAGKSTLLKIIAGLLMPYDGDVLYKGCSIFDDIQHYHQNMTYFGHKLGYQQLLSPHEVFNAYVKNAQQLNAINGLIDKFKISGYLNSPIHTLSAGTKRKLGLTIALSSLTNIWLLDEPMVSLDKDSIMVVTDALEQHLIKGGSCLITSHQLIPIPGIFYQEYRL